MKLIFIRVVCDLFIFATLFLLPWWLFIFACVLGVLLIDRHYELVVFGFMADAAYAGGVGGADTHVFFLLTTTALVLLSIIVKPRLVFYESRA